MNTKLLMTISAVFLGVTGIALSFFPQEIAVYLHLSSAIAIVLQICGALYFGFAMLNWTAKANLIGAIYSKPVAIANFAHFLIGGLTLIKYAFTNTGVTPVWIAAIIYLLFAILFGYVLFVHRVFGNKSV
jgi:tellurite resistance protein TehA-like permease